MPCVKCSDGSKAVVSNWSRLSFGRSATPEFVYGVYRKEVVTCLLKIARKAFTSDSRLPPRSVGERDSALENMSGHVEEQMVGLRAASLRPGVPHELFLGSRESLADDLGMVEKRQLNLETAWYWNQRINN